MPERTRGENQRRLLRMVRLLMQGDRLDRHRAAKKFAIKHATAHRGLTLIADEVPDVVVDRSESPQVYRYEKAAVPQGAAITWALAATFGAASARLFRGTIYEDQLRILRSQMIERLTGRRRQQFKEVARKFVVLGGEEEVLDDREELLDDVTEAVLDQREIVVEYRDFDDNVEEHTLRPFSLVVSRSRLYVVAPKPGYAAYPFRFQRIVKAEITDRKFDYPAPSAYDPARLFQDSMGIFVDPEPVDVLIQLDSRWSSYARHHKWHHSQRVTFREGRVELRMHVRPCHELKQWILSFGEDAEVLEPIGLRNEIAGRLEKAAAVYKR